MGDRGNASHLLAQLSPRRYLDMFFPLSPESNTHGTPGKALVRLEMDTKDTGTG